MESKIEVWLPIPGYENLYSVSSFGNVRAEHYGKGVGQGQQLLCLYKQRKGYLIADLTKDGVRRHWLVHILVALAFLGPKPTPQHQVNHKDGVKTNNRPRNLEWLSPSEHLQHTQNAGLFKTVLTKDDVQTIMELLLARVPQKQIAARFNTTQATISRIKLGQTWGHITKPGLTVMEAQARKKGRPFNNDRVSLD
jgi:hypothetical protein